MKVPPATLEAMRDAIAPLDTPTVRCAYLRGEFPRAELVKVKRSSFTGTRDEVRACSSHALDRRG